MKKGQKRVFFAPDKDENHRLRNSRKRKGESEERGGRKEVNRKIRCTLSFYVSYFGPKKDRLKEGVYLAVTFTQIRLIIHYSSITRLQVPFYET